MTRRLGQGGFGYVWLAEEQTLTGREVAVKMPLSDEPDMELIRREVKIWVQASGHANLLPVLNADVYDGQVVIVSEYAPDGSLKDWLKLYNGQPVPVEYAVPMMAGILAGLEHLHSRGITHRDLKPANILLHGSTPRLTDFGISRVLTSKGQSSVAMGTPTYMPPEAFEARYDHRTDIWLAAFPFLSRF